MVVRRFSPRPKFSAPTRLVFAKLDRALPFDQKAIDEMAEKKIIIPVSRHPFLRRRFRRAGQNYNDIYAIPFRRPVHSVYNPRPKGVDTHGRSIYTTGAGERQFVFKGVGALNLRRSFQLDRSEPFTERRFVGGARRETIEIAVQALAKLEEGFQYARKNRDALIQWAEQFGVTELPVIKHAAVFTPLQFASSRESPSRRLRVAITTKTFARMELEKFYRERRVHVYTAREPRRLEELKTGDKAMYKWLKTRRVSLSDSDAVKREILKQFIARGLVLLHVAHSNGITLSSASGSSLFPSNTSPLEFFDFDTSEWEKKGGELAFEKERAITYFGESVHKLIEVLWNKYITTDIDYYAGHALDSAARKDLSATEKRKVFDQSVNNVVRQVWRSFRSDSG